MLGQSGALAQALPGYEARKPQVRMADLCQETLEDGGTALIEAGTGTGKSFAYLLPALKSGKKVIVSTDTIQLQEQLVKKDLPWLCKTLGLEATFAIAKGRGNYLCRRNADAFLQESSLVRPDEVKAVGELLRSAWDGDRSTLAVKLDHRTWEDIAADETCTAQACPHFANCPLIQAKQAVANADLIVTNHTMYLLHHAIARHGLPGLFPEHTSWIADEAHTLAEKAAEAFGAEISQTRPVNVADRLSKQLRNLKCTLTYDREELVRINAALFDLFRFGQDAYTLFTDLDEDDLELGRARKEKLTKILNGLRRQVVGFAEDEVVALAGELSEQERKEGTARKNALLGAVSRLEDLIEDINSVFRPDEDMVIYAERVTSKHGDVKVTLRRQPADTHFIFKDILAELESSVFTSATLTDVRGLDGWKSIANELGVDLRSAEVMQAKSPFDYATQVVGYVPDDVLEHTDQDYHASLARSLDRVLSQTSGGAFILFTATQDMEKVKGLLRTGRPVLMQGEMERQELIERFKSQRNAVLLGVKTFWTGVDIPGEALSCVCIVKFPFPQSGHPLVKAKCERIKARGGSDFNEYFLPRCIRDLRQGFGRLIRSRQDKGVFVICDARMHTKRYAQTIAKALPQFPVRSAL